MRTDLTGKSFERLTVLRYSHNNRFGAAVWECKCACGRTSIVPSGDLLSGHTRSCGCLHTEMFRHRTHSGCGTRLYRIWKNMHTRCENPKYHHWHRYGGRGVRICDEWKDFSTFRDWALSHGYVDNMTIDRIDNDGNYDPWNCQWITQSENSAKQSRDRVAS